jgi:hypothetical protein
MKMKIKLLSVFSTFTLLFLSVYSVSANSGLSKERIIPLEEYPIIEKIDTYEVLERIMEEGTVISYKDITDEFSQSKLEDNTISSLQLDKDERIVQQEVHYKEKKGRYYDVSSNEIFEETVEYNITAIGIATPKEATGDFQIADNNDKYFATWDTWVYLRSDATNRNGAIKINKYSHGYKAGSQFGVTKTEFISVAGDADHETDGNDGPVFPYIYTQSAPYSGEYMDIIDNGFRCARASVWVKRLVSGATSSDLSATNQYGSCVWMGM